MWGEEGGDRGCYCCCGGGAGGGEGGGAGATAAATVAAGCSGAASWQRKVPTHQLTCLHPPTHPCMRACTHRRPLPAAALRMAHRRTGAHAHAQSCTSPAARRCHGPPLSGCSKPEPAAARHIISPARRSSGHPEVGVSMLGAGAGAAASVLNRETPTSLQGVGSTETQAVDGPAGLSPTGVQDTRFTPEVLPSGGGGGRGKAVRFGASGWNKMGGGG